MDFFDVLDTRASALRLTAPGPSPEHLDRLLSAGVRAPDHGRLTPWRFLVLEGDDRLVLGRAMVDAALRKRADAGPAELQREHDKVLRAPTIVVVSAAVVDHPKIPPLEQVETVAAGACNMMLAAHALGLGSMWKTGAPADNPGVKAALGLADTEIVVGFMYFGTLQMGGEPRSVDHRPLTRRL